jgi:hypothetical protein
MRRRPRIARRRFLGAAAASIALPMLEAHGLTRASAGPPAKRLVCIGSFLGLHAPALYPHETGHGYQLTPLLEPLAAHRGDFTLFSGLDHRAPNGHGFWQNFLTGQMAKGISLDQVVAAKLGEQTRLPSLEVSAGETAAPMCQGPGGVPLPMIERPSVVYGKLFTSPQNRIRTEYLLTSGRSALDEVTAETKALLDASTGADRAKLDEYFTAVREVERRMSRHLVHLGDPAPQVDYALPPHDPISPEQMIECEEVMQDLIALALATDTTRVASLLLSGAGQTFTIGGRMLQNGYHGLSHHGNDPAKVRDLVAIDTEHMRCLARLLTTLKNRTDGEGRPLLDTTVVLFGTGMGDASRHSNENLPTIVAGGGFKHGRHLAFSGADMLLGDLFITIQRQLGIEAERFSNATHGLDSVLT